MSFIGAPFGDLGFYTPGEKHRRHTPIITEPVVEFIREIALFTFFTDDCP